MASTNIDVDYVIVYRYATTEKQKAASTFENLVAALSKAGLQTEVRVGDSHSLLVFVRVASQEYLHAEVYRSRAHDWLHGVRTAAPKTEVKESLQEEPLYEAERLRIIYQMITNPIDEGGAGISPKHGDWKQVESIFSLHDHTFNKNWIKKWSTTYFLKPEDLDEIRDRFGEKIAYYFAFTQSYFAFLIFPAAFGFTAWALFGHFSPIYAIVNALWCIVFTEWWKHQEKDLAVRWGVKGVSNIEHARQEFKHKKEAVDPVTGEKVLVFSATERLQRQLLNIPFGLVAILMLGSLISICFAIEIFISEVYDGPLKWILVFLPTGILTTVNPVLINLLTKIAMQLNEYENYETQAAYDAAYTSKIFVLNFITSYLPIFLTAFVYVPFAKTIVPFLDIFSLTVRPFAEHEGQLKAPTSGKGFSINPSRLRKQVIYFTVTAQIVNLGLELILPYVSRKGAAKFKEFQSKRAMQHGGSVPKASEHDVPEESAFLNRVRQEATLSDYDVTSDLREMVVQFGYLSLFSVIWPLTAVSFLINNWIELRADAMKICVEMKRPIPARADTIGPWLDSLSLLTWLGSLTSSALVYMFLNDDVGPGGDCSTIKAWALLLTVFFSEHIFLVIRIAVRTAISKIESEGSRKERRARYLLRQQFLGPMEKLNKPSNLGGGDQDFSRASLEEQARQGSLKVSTPEERFWARQVGWKESAAVGTRLIEHSAPQYDESTKKEL